MSSRSKRRLWSDRTTPRVPQKRALLQFEHLEDRTMLDATGIAVDSQMIAWGGRSPRTSSPHRSPRRRTGDGNASLAGCLHRQLGRRRQPASYQ